jgi:two-component system chemotaxis sensor kinase CheA
MDDLLADFLTETTESLAELDLALVRLERAPDDAQTLSLIFRHVHTVKGTCGFLGLARLERVAHAAENVLGRLRDRLLTVTPEVISAVLAAADCIKAIVAGIAATEAEPAGNDEVLIAALNAIAEGRPVAVAAPVPARPPAAAPATAVAAAAVAAVPAAARPEVPAPVVAAVPAVAAPAAVVAVAPVVAAEPAGGEPHAEQQSQTIRVTVDVLEDLMTLVSELVLTRNQLLQLARRQENSAFAVPLQRLSQITSDLQEGVVKTRMQPIGHAWNKLPRLVRDLARDLGKKIELTMLGAETELDRQVLEMIKDPLTHMVRNSGDHGLETPAERRAAGKSETGRISLNAYHEGGHIVIEITDDGRGLPVDKIRAKALARGLATEAELAAMHEEQVLRFIFRAGFSTAAAVTAVSGRGVGLDVVKTNIERIGGLIEMRNAAGQGTTFIIKIPLTLAIASALIVASAGERFAIPQLAVVELVHARTRAADQGRGQAGAGQGSDAAGDSAPDGGETRIEQINGTPVLRLRNRLLPLVNLAELLQLGPGPAARDGQAGAAAEAPVDDGARYIVVTQVGASTLGIIVDQVFDTEEIVVKPVAPILRHVTMFSGNTILGDGSVIMILDPNGIARATGVGGVEQRAAEPAASPRLAGGLQSGGRTSLLVFRAGGSELKAVPLGLVARLENITRERIELSAGLPVTQYRGRLMRLVPLSGHMDMMRDSHPVLVFSDTDRGPGRDRSMGLVVDEILDVADDNLRVELTGERPGLLGTAVISGRATDVIDTAYWLQQAFHDWFQGVARGAADGVARALRVLVVEDTDFFRNLVVPALSAAGYEVTATGDGAQALRLRDAGTMFDAIVSDIEMPDMDGLAFVRRVRAEGRWADLPVIALTAHARPEDIAAGRAAGFTDYVAKFERDALLASLQQCLAQSTARREAVQADPHRADERNRADLRKLTA